MPKVATKKPRVKEATDYTASIKVLGKTYTAQGSTARDAIDNLEVGSVARGVSLISVSKGNMKKDKVLTSMQTSRLFSRSPLMREIALKNVSLMFDF